MPLTKQEKRFYNISLFIIFVIFGFCTSTEVSTLSMVLRTGWDGGAGNMLSPREATIYYSVTATTFLLLLSALAYFAFKRKRTTVVILCFIFVLAIAASSLVYYLLIHSLE